MELVGYHFDHAKRRSILGYLPAMASQAGQCLQLDYHDGFNFYPVDMAVHTSKNRTNQDLKQIDKRTNGWRRRKEVFEKKTDVLLEMLERSWNYGIPVCVQRTGREASFVLFDGWFSHDALISKAVSIGYGHKQPKENALAAGHERERSKPQGIITTDRAGTNLVYQ
jgi:hypothetical protein